MEPKNFSTIDVHKINPDQFNQTNKEFNGNKNFADLRIKLGRK